MEMEFTYMSLPIEEKLAECAAKVEAALDEYLSDGYIGSSGLAEAMRYSTLGGGKRIRAVLVLETAKCSAHRRRRRSPLPVRWR